MQTSLFPRELTPERVLGELLPRQGAANGITARDLVYVLTGKQSPAEERRLRLVIERLRLLGHPICAHPALGYYVAANDSDLNYTCSFLYGRALTSLRQISAMKRVALPDLRGQLGLPLDATPENDDESTTDG
jgi:hypothetical protein